MTPTTLEERTGRLTPSPRRIPSAPRAPQRSPRDTPHTKGQRTLETGSALALDKKGA